MGRQREKSIHGSGHDDSGYGTPAKIPRIASSVTEVSPALIPELERAYEGLYLCKPGSLHTSFVNGEAPPLRNSPHKYLAAINSTPGWGRSISKQLARVQAVREQGPGSVVVVNCDS